MTKFINFVPQSWQSWALLLACCLVVGDLIYLLLRERKGKQNSAWQKRLKESLPASSSSTLTGQPSTMPKTMKKSAVILLMIPLMVIFTGAGYAGRDMQLRAGYKAEHEKWMSCLANWEKVYFAYEVKYVPKDK